MIAPFPDLCLLVPFHELMIRNHALLQLLALFSKFTKLMGLIKTFFSALNPRCSVTE